VKTLYCAFNATKQSFINLGVTVADTPFARLRGLLGKARMRCNEALWVIPSHGVHTIGLRFPIDVLYLDAQQRVVDLIECLAPRRIPALRWNCASVLELPAHSIFCSGTEAGDQLVIGSPEDLKHYWDAERIHSDLKESGSYQDERVVAIDAQKGLPPWPSGADPESL